MQRFRGIRIFEFVAKNPVSNLENILRLNLAKFYLISSYLITVTCLSSLKCSILLLLKMCNKLANLNKQTLIQSRFKLYNLYRINYLCNLITLHIGLSPSLGANSYTITYHCNLATLYFGLSPSRGVNLYIITCSYNN